MYVISISYVCSSYRFNTLAILIADIESTFRRTLPTTYIRTVALCAVHVRIGAQGVSPHFPRLVRDRTFFQVCSYHVIRVSVLCKLYYL